MPIPLGFVARSGDLMQWHYYHERRLPSRPRRGEARGTSAARYVRSAMSASWTASLGWRPLTFSLGMGE